MPKQQKEKDPADKTLLLSWVAGTVDKGTQLGHHGRGALFLLCGKEDAQPLVEAFGGEYKELVTSNGKSIEGWTLPVKEEVLLYERILPHMRFSRSKTKVAKYVASRRAELGDDFFSAKK